MINADRAAAIAELEIDLDSPYADEPLVGSGNRSFSARQILEEIKSGTEIGEKFLRAHIAMKKAMEQG